MGRFKSKLDILRQTYRLCRLGGMPEPKWLGPYLQLNRLGELDLGGGKHLGKSQKAKRQQFPEDRFIQSFYDRYPHAKLQPVDLDSFEPPPVKKLAVRQQALMERSGGSKMSLQAIEQQMLDSGELKIPQKPSVIAQIQAEEERVLMAAIQQRKQARTSS